MAERLKRCVHAAFEGGCRAARAGVPVAHVGRAVERIVTSSGFVVLRDLSGHGVGRAIHEQPTVPNFYDPFQKSMLTEGLVVTIEPIISERSRPSDRWPSAAAVTDSPGIVQDDDGWALRTDDGSLAAHYEHTVIITRGVPIIVTKSKD